MSGDEGAAPPTAELITQLQDRVNLICTMLYDFLGSLQRDAWPLPVSKDADEVVAPPLKPPVAGEPAFNADEATARMSQMLLQEFKATEQLIKLIPQEVQGEDAHYERIRLLQTRDAELSQQLAAAAAEAETQLADLQRVFALLAQQRLQLQAMDTTNAAVRQGAA